MNVCVFSRQVFWQGVKGGMEIHGKLLSEGLVNKGCSVTTISTRHPEGVKHEVRKGVNFHYLENTIFGSRRNGWAKESVKKFLHLNKVKPFDVVWSQSFDAFGLTKNKKDALDIPIIPVLQGCIHQEIVTFLVRASMAHKRPIKTLKALAGLFFSYFAIQRKLLSCADVVITPSYQVPRDIERWFGSKTRSKCLTVFNGIDTELFKPNHQYRRAIRQRYGIDGNTILLLSAGRLIKEKGHHITIDVLSRLKLHSDQIKLMIVGDGENLDDFKSRVKKYCLEEDVIFTGFIENTETVKYFNCCDIFLMPTLREEGLPFVLIETMACQKPSVVSKIGGNISVIDDNRNGILVDPGSIDAMVKKVLFLINNDIFAGELARCARQTVIKKFSVEKMVNQTFEVFKDYKKKQ